MKSIELLKRIIKTPFIFSSEQKRAIAKYNLLEKMKRRNRKILKRSQTKLEL